MPRYKAGYKFLGREVHAQVLDFPAVITCGTTLDEARQLLAFALVDMAETYWESGQSLPLSNSLAADAEMDLEEPIYLHFSASTQVEENPAGVVAPRNARM